MIRLGPLILLFLFLSSTPSPCDGSVDDKEGLNTRPTRISQIQQQQKQQEEEEEQRQKQKHDNANINEAEEGRIPQTIPTKSPGNVTGKEMDISVMDGPAMNATSKEFNLNYHFSVKPAPAEIGEAVLPETNVGDKSKRIWVVTTAALPWKTGTAVNALLRSAYLTIGRKVAGGSVTLLLPWLEKPQDRIRIYGESFNFSSPLEQEGYIRDWLKNTAEMADASEELNIKWYIGWVQPSENSVYSMGDITALIPESDADICVLEEPEHLNWYRAPGESWTNKFKHVVGVVHTNYFVYAQEQPAALIRAPAMRLLCSWMCRAHCHRIIKLSGTLGQFAPEKELVENVHGVRRSFLEIGERNRNHPIDCFTNDADPTVYFIGKMLWSKGLGSLMELLKYAEETKGLKVKVDMYGGGPNKDDAMIKAHNLDLHMPFHGPIDHAELGYTHKIFVNPSTSEVLCTTAAEALAMGKFVVLPSHPSNDFFEQFPNCLPYANKEEFVENLDYAMTHSPEPLSVKDARTLSWEAATERFEAAASIPVAEAHATAQALNTSGASVEISLPPLIEDQQRAKISAVLRLTRTRYRSFRSRLSQEIQQSNLPKYLQQRLVTELDKRLDFDLDKILDSPKLLIKLSPAEFDKQLLDLYKTVSTMPSADVLRIIGGGTTVGKQKLFIERQSFKEKKKNKNSTTLLSNEELIHDTENDDAEGNEDHMIDNDILASTPTDTVKTALRRNLPISSESTFIPTSSGLQKKKTKNNSPKMSLDRFRNVPNDCYSHNNAIRSRWIFGSNACAPKMLCNGFLRPKIR